MWAGSIIFAALLQLANNAAIEGVVFNRMTQASVPNVTVKIASASAPNDPLYTVKSDALGEFRIEEAMDGDYVATFVPPRGYLYPTSSDSFCKPFHFTRGGSTNKLRVPLTPFGKLSGRVLDGLGNPVSHVRVEIYPLPGPNRVSFSRRGSDEIDLVSDREGRFLTDAIAPGEFYQLRARPVLPGTALEQKLKIVSPLPTYPAEGKNWAWVPTYYPNTIDIESAETVVSQMGVDLSGYEIHLQSAPVYRVGGLVSDDNGNPIGGVEVRLGPKPEYHIADAYVASRKDGTFEFPSVPEGRWYIDAELSQKETAWRGSTELIVPNHDIRDVKLRIGPPLILNGVVEGIPYSQGRRVGVTVWLVQIDGSGSGFGWERSDGSLHVEHLYEGYYRIGEIGEKPGYYLDSILLGTEDVLGRNVFVGPNSPLLRVTFRPNAARVVGSVENGAAAKVVLVEADREHYRPGSLRVVVCDEDGRFTIEGLRPTSYYVFASATFNGSEDATTKAIFAGGLGRQVQTVNLSEGETATLHLNLAPWPE